MTILSLPAYLARKATSAKVVKVETEPSCWKKLIELGGSQSFRHVHPGSGDGGFLVVVCRGWLEGFVCRPIDGQRNFEC